MLGWTMTSYPSPRIVALGRMALISGSGLPGVGYLHGSGDYKVLWEMERERDGERERKRDIQL